MAGENINRKLNIYINDKEVVNSATGINKALASVRNQMKSLVKGTDDYDEKLKVLKATYAQLKDEQEAFNEELELSNNNFGAARESAISFFTALASGDVASAQTAILGMRGAILATTKAAWAFVTTPLGIFFTALAGIAGVTKMWVNYNEEVYKANKLTNGITKLTGDNLDSVRVRAQALSETFDQDFTKVLETARALVNEFDISYEEALSSLEEGLIKGGAANDEFLDSMREYPTFFATAGYSLAEFQNLVNSGLDVGIYQDKLPDAIKEFTLSVNEQTKSASDALRNAFGKEFTSNLLKGVKDGSITAKQALELISKEAERIGLNAQQAQQLTADLFRGAGEDAGGALKIFEAVNKSLKDQIEPLNEVEQATAELVKSNKDLAQAQEDALKSDGYARWKTKALIALNEVKKGFWDLTAAIFNNETEQAAALKNTGKQKGLEEYNAVLKNIANTSKEQQEATKKEMLARERENIRVNQAIIKSEKEKRESIIGGDRALFHHQTKLEEAALIQVTKSAEKIKLLKQASSNNAGGKSGGSRNTNSAADQDADKKASEEAAKLREKELKAAQKHAEELIKQELDLQKQLLATRRTAEDMKLGLIADDYEREKALINADFNRKIEDYKANAAKEQEEIAKIKTELASSKTSKSDASVLKKQLAERLEIQAAYNQTAVLSEQTRVTKLAALEEKYLQKSFQDQETKNARELQNLRTRQTEELNSVKTLEDAKAVLAQYLSDDELSKVTSLSNAKKEIKKRFLKEEFDLQQRQLYDIMAKAREILGQTDEFGLELISGEERDKVLKFLDDAAAKLAALGVKDPNAEDKDKALAGLSGIDILGFNPEQWAMAFDNLTTFEGKLAAITAVVGGLQNAFGMYFNFLDAGDKRNLQRFESANNKKRAALADQLEKGYISQEVYNARLAKADQELAKKKAEIEYKQAKRQKAMQAAQVISSTALAIMGIWRDFPKFDFGISAGVMSGIVGTLGAAQLATVLAQPLPDKNGFYDGGFTGTGNPRGEAGPVHFNEYVVPQKVLFSNDPVVPHIVGYLEGKRTGKITSSNQEEGTMSSSQQTTSVSTQDSPVMLSFMARMFQIFDKLEKEGFVGFIENDIKTARKIRDKIKEVEKLENNAKA